MSIFSLYATFWIDSFLNREARIFIAGNNNHNLVVFSPWIVLLISTSLFLLTKRIHIYSIIIGALGTIGLLLYAMPLHVFLGSLIDLFTKK